MASDGEQQQGVTDWATGKKLPSSKGFAANTACVAIKAGYSDFWCQSTCGALVRVRVRVRRVRVRVRP